MSDLLDPTILFADEHEGLCCDCCNGYCTLADDAGPWWPAIYKATLAGAEYLGRREILVRRDAVADLPEDVSVHTAPVGRDVPWAVVPAKRPPSCGRPQTAALLDRLDRSGLTWHKGKDIVHLYRGSEHVGWSKWAVDPTKGITVADLPAVRNIAKVIGLDMRRAAQALHLIRDGATP